MALSKKTSVIIAAIVVVLGVVVYMVWIREPAEPNVSEESAVGTTEAQSAFLTLAARLEPVSFDDAILSDSRFMSLVDIKTAIVPEATGKTDPFAPLPGVARE